MGVDVSTISYNPLNRNDSIETGFYAIDSHLDDLCSKELTIVFGRNGEGKTTFINQIIAHNLGLDVPVYLYSGELSDYKIQDWIYKAIIGNNKLFYNIIEGKYKPKKIIKPEIIQALKKWHKNKFFLYSESNNIEETKIRRRSLVNFFDNLVQDIKAFQPKLIILDNLMSAMEERANSIWSDQSNFVEMCNEILRRFDTHIILVVHPNKFKSEIESQEPNLSKTDISGSNNIANKADNIIAIERNWFGKEDERICDGFASILKNREDGQRKVIDLWFNVETFRLYDEHRMNSTKKEKYEFLQYVENPEKYMISKKSTNSKNIDIWG